MVANQAKPAKIVKISRPTKSTLKQSTKPTLRKAASPRQTLSKSLGAVASNKWMKKADVKWTVELAEKALLNAKQKLRTHDASMWWTKQQHDALKKQVNIAEKNLKSLNKNR